MNVQSVLPIRSYQIKNVHRNWQRLTLLSPCCCLSSSCQIRKCNFHKSCTVWHLYFSITVTVMTTSRRNTYTNTQCRVIQMQTSSGGNGIRVGMRSTGSSVSSFVSATTASGDSDYNITQSQCHIWWLRNNVDTIQYNTIFIYLELPERSSTL